MPGSSVSGDSGAGGGPARRVDVIRCRLAYHVMEELGAAAASPHKDEWEGMGLNGNYRFGWMPPYQVSPEDPDTWVVVFCPELIAETTAFLDDDELQAYLDIIKAFINGVVEHPELAPSQAERLVEDDVYEKDPAALELLSRVQVWALDEGIVQP